MASVLLYAVRIAVAYRGDVVDGRVNTLVATLPAEGIKQIDTVRIADIYIVDGVAVPRAALEELLADDVARVVIEEGSLGRADLLIEVAYRPGVHDPVSGTLREVVGLLIDPLPEKTVLQTARQYRFSFVHGVDVSAVANRLSAALHNPLIERVTVIDAISWGRGQRPLEQYPTIVADRAPGVDLIDVAAMKPSDLMRLSSERLLALSAEELAAIRAYAADPDVRSQRIESGIWN